MRLKVGETLLKHIYTCNNRSASNSSLGYNFELLAVQSLRKNQIDVWKCGAPGDRGADFRGVWSLRTSQVNVLGQCKCYKRKLGPVHFRELEGTLSHEQQSTLGMIVTNIGFTKGAYQHFMSSTYPLALAVLNYSLYDIAEIEPPSLQDYHTYSYNNSYKKNVSSSIRDTQSFEGGQTFEKMSTEIRTQYHTNDLVKQSHYTSDENLYEYRGHSETQLAKENNKYLDENNLPQQTQNMHENRTQFGGLVLFDLNISARQLMPSVVIGKMMNKNNTGSLDLVLSEK